MIENMMKHGRITAGIDEAGRGPVIGPLIIGCVVLDENGRKNLKKLNVRDSKKVTPLRRAYLEPKIKENAIEWSLIEISPREIDILRKRHSLNAIEAVKVAEIILSLKNIPEIIYLDAVDNNAHDYGNRIINILKSSNKSLDEDFIIPEIVSEHKADDRYIEVAAASILAKVERDRIIRDIRDKYGDFGSGYPSDERTRVFIRKLIRDGKLPEFVRRSWNTLNKGKQMRLNEF